MRILAILLAILSAPAMARSIISDPYIPEPGISPPHTCSYSEDAGTALPRIVDAPVEPGTLACNIPIDDWNEGSAHTVSAYYTNAAGKGPAVTWTFTVPIPDKPTGPPVQLRCDCEVVE